MRKKIQKYIHQECRIDLSQKTYIITGANSGIGFELARELLFLHAKVIMACRSLKKAKQAKEQLLEEFQDAQIEMIQLDLSSFDSIRQFCTYIKENKIDIHGFINNAGVYRKPNEKTADGYELVMGTNYLGPYVLNTFLLPYFFSLEHEVKLIFTSSLAYHFGKIKYDDFFYESHYHSMKVYATSKLCINQFACHLKNLCEGTSVRVCLTHPGVSYTPLIQKGYNKVFAKVAEIFMKCFFHKADQGALGALYILTHDVENGYMNGPRGLFHIKGFPSREKLSLKAQQDINRLMEYTKRITNISLPQKQTNH